MYAETLLELAARQDEEGTWLEMLSEIVGLYQTSPQFKAFLHTPRVADAEKRRVLRGSF
jgi:F0F1-type ATP synthase delta subunit